MWVVVGAAVAGFFGLLTIVAGKLLEAGTPTARARAAIHADLTLLDAVPDDFAHRDDLKASAEARLERYVAMRRLSPEGTPARPGDLGDDDDRLSWVLLVTMGVFLTAGIGAFEFTNVLVDQPGPVLGASAVIGVVIGIVGRETRRRRRVK